MCGSEAWMRFHLGNNKISSLTFCGRSIWESRTSNRSKVWRLKEFIKIRQWSTI